MKQLYPHAHASFASIKKSIRLILLCSVIGLSASSQTLNFSTYTLESGTNYSAGAVYRFSHVTAAGNVDALVTVTSLFNVELKSIDSAFTGTVDGFQPMVSSINGNGDHYALFNIRFVQAGTSIAVNLANFKGTFFDLNGSNQINEYASIDLANASWQYSNGTPGIVVTQTSSLILGTSNNNSLSQSIDTANKSNSFIVTSQLASSFNVKFGFSQTVKGWSGNDQFSLLFEGVPAISASLPVTLINWSAAYADNKVALKWTTTIETNANYFTIERSFDGKEFTDKAMLFAAGNSNTINNYSYNDQIPDGSNGLVYYRLKMVDLDGRYKMSETKVVRIGKPVDGVKIMAYPNPVVNEMRVSIPQSWQGKNINYTINGTNGQLVKSYNVQFASQTEVIEMSQIPGGMYIIRVSNGKETAIQTVVKAAR